MLSDWPKVHSHCPAGQPGPHLLAQDAQHHNLEDPSTQPEARVGDVVRLGVCRATVT